MSRPVTFSICIPNFNYGHYIGLTIQSVLDQTYPHFEIIVADNASTDNSVEVVRSFNDGRIRLIHNQANFGFAPNLDRATEMATGDYMILLSSDDLMAPGALTKYAQVIHEYQSEDTNLVISSDIGIINKDGETIGDSKNWGLERQSSRTGIIKEPIVSNDSMVIYHGLDLLDTVLQGSLTNIGKFLSTCYPKRLYYDVGGYHSIMSVIPDAHFSHKLMFSNPVVIFVKEILFQYRVHDRNNFTSMNEHIKILCDKYVLTQTYTNDILKPTGLTQARLQRNFIHSCCLMQPLFMLLTGRGTMAIRHYAFGLSAYPKLMARDVLSWLIPLCFLIYPALFLSYLGYKKLLPRSVGNEDNRCWKR